MRGLFQFVGLAISLLPLTRAADGQTVIGLQPVVSYYLPLGHFNQADLLSTALPQRPIDLRGVAWGGNLQLEIRSRFAVEGVVETTSHTLPSCLCPGGAPTAPVPIRVSLAALAGQYDLSSHPARYHLWADVGPAVVRHTGRGYERPDSPISWGGILGLELAVPMASRWEFVTGANGVGYSFSEDFPPQHGPQLDALVSIGVRWHS